jgi:chromate reductase, NAD(P)H dehydrogenase (quinone)
MNDPVTILGFAGSLRRGSYNRGALRAAVEVVPAGARLETFELDGIPPFNQDEEQNLPERVALFKARIRAADAILIVTPEYNYSVPGVLKNAIDWASRPYGANAWDGKPVAIMGAGGGLGTARAQYHLRQSFIYLKMLPLADPEVMISGVTKKFDAQGNLTDDETRQRIRQLLEALIAWTRRLAGEPRVTAAG